MQGILTKDGDLDLFVGGRLTPGKYPLAPQSYILKKRWKKAISPDVTEKIAPQLINTGMVCDALWTDYDNDNDLDLIVAGEWTPINFLENKNGTLTHNSSRFIGTTRNSSGWWNCLSAADMDNERRHGLYCRKFRT